MTIAFLFVSVVMLIGAVAWFAAVKYLPGDTARVEAATV